MTERGRPVAAADAYGHVDAFFGEIDEAVGE